MSLNYRVKVDKGDLPTRYVLRLGYWTRLVFDNVKDATRAFEAISKSLGAIKDESYEFKRNGETYSSSTEVVKELEDKFTIEPSHVGTVGEVLYASTWAPYIRCDGVPKGDGSMCGCWETCEATPELTASDDRWAEYTEGGKLRHMCHKCQEKDVKVATVIVTQASC